MSLPAPRPLADEHDPLAEVARERERARAAGDPLADVCVLATVDEHGRPQAPPLTLREVDERGFGLLVSRTSPKWRQVRDRGAAGLLIHWPLVRRQYRAFGHFEAMEPERLARHWAGKSQGSRLLEHLYRALPQSRPVASRAALEEGIAALARGYPVAERTPIPPELAGVVLVPREIEVWHGSPEDRLHDRRLFRRVEGGWASEILVP